MKTPTILNIIHKTVKNLQFHKDSDEQNTPFTYTWNTWVTVEICYLWK